MLFMLLATDVEGTAQARAEARPAHLARLEELDAEEWAGQDPYVQAGVYAEVLIKPYKKVFPK